jgi:hypothetical protein
VDEYVGLRHVPVLASATTLELLTDHAQWIERMKRFYTAEELARERERRRREIGDWTRKDAERKPGFFRRLIG